MLGGVLTEAISWHWIFFVNLPIGDRDRGVATRLLERDRGIGLVEGADVPGAVLVTGALMLGVYTIVEAPSRLGLGADPGPRRDRDRTAGRVRLPPGAPRTR